MLAQNSRKTAKTLHRRFRRFCLWTTLSGFESLPPSQFNFQNHSGLRLLPIREGQPDAGHVIGFTVGPCN